MNTILLVVGILVFLIVVHELGHFVAAKIFRVKVEEFGIGYPPRAFLLGRLGGTEYTLNWIPFGGFVKLLGENEVTLRERGSFSAAPRSSQGVVLAAGVIMNVVAAWGLFAGALTIGIPHAIRGDETDVNARLLVYEVLPGSPAAESLQAGDEILEVAGEKGEKAPLDPVGMVAFVGDHGGLPLALLLKRGDGTLTATITPAHAVAPDAAYRPALGAKLVRITSESLPPLEAITAAVPLTLQKLLDVSYGIANMAVRAFQGKPPLTEIIGPVGLVGVIGEAAGHGVSTVLVLAGIISLNLAVVNLIPIPALDGGRLFLLGVESLMRRSVSRLSVYMFNAAGIVMIVALMIVVTYNDIVRLIS